LAPGETYHHQYRVFMVVVILHNAASANTAAGKAVQSAVLGWVNNRS